MLILAIEPKRKVEDGLFRNLAEIHDHSSILLTDNHDIFGGLHLMATFIDKRLLLFLFGKEQVKS